MTLNRPAQLESNMWAKLQTAQVLWAAVSYFLYDNYIS
jgi:hypothetical protein